MWTALKLFEKIIYYTQDVTEMAELFLINQNFFPMIFLSLNLTFLLLSIFKHALNSSIFKLS